MSLACPVLHLKTTPSLVYKYLGRGESRRTSIYVFAYLIVFVFDWPLVHKNKPIFIKPHQSKLRSQFLSLLTVGDRFIVVRKRFVK